MSIAHHHDATTCTRTPCRLCVPSRAPQPPPYVNMEHQGPTAIPDPVVASIGLPRHRSMGNIAENGHATAAKVHLEGTAAVRMAAVLAARGWGTSTLGDGGSRGTDSTSAPERSVLADYVDRWTGVDRLLAQRLADYDKASSQLAKLIADLLHHAKDHDPIPAGTGECQACGRFCRPDGTKPGNRLRAGLCPTDYRAWLRAGQPARSDWVRTKRSELTDDQGVLHTPEPDHDIDLTSEKAGDIP